MPTFDWTVSLGTVATILSMLVTVGFAWYRVVTNHLRHFREDINSRFDKVDADIRELRGFAFRQENRP